MNGKLLIVGAIGIGLRNRIPYVGLVGGLIVTFVVVNFLTWFTQHRRRFAKLVHNPFLLG